MASRRGKQSTSTDAPVGDAPGAPGEIEGEGDGPRQGLPELMRKAFAAGLSGFFFTEEAIRKAVGDTLPKDWSDFAVEQSTRTRAEFLERLSYELGRTLENVDYAAVLAQLLEGRTLEVTAQVKLLPRQPGEDPRLEVKVDPGREDA